MLGSARDPHQGSQRHTSQHELERKRSSQGASSTFVWWDHPATTPQQRTSHVQIQGLGLIQEGATVTRHVNQGLQVKHTQTRRSHTRGKKKEHTGRGWAVHGNRTFILISHTVLYSSFSSAGMLGMAWMEPRWAMITLRMSLFHRPSFIRSAIMYLLTTIKSPDSTRRVYRFEVKGSNASLLPRICTETNEGTTGNQGTEVWATHRLAQGDERERVGVGWG